MSGGRLESSAKGDQAVAGTIRVVCGLDVVSSLVGGTDGGGGKKDRK